MGLLPQVSVCLVMVSTVSARGCPGDHRLAGTIRHVRSRAARLLPATQVVQAVPVGIGNWCSATSPVTLCRRPHRSLGPSHWPSYSAQASSCSSVRSCRTAWDENPGAFGSPSQVTSSHGQGAAQGGAARGGWLGRVDGVGGSQQVVGDHRAQRPGVVGREPTGGQVRQGSVDQVGEHGFDDSVLTLVRSAAAVGSVLLVRNGW